MEKLKKVFLFLQRIKDKTKKKRKNSVKTDLEIRYQQRWMYRNE